MIIRSFVGGSVAEALKMIRSDMGPKAVVLKTKSLSAGESGVGRRMIEITACLERPTIGALESSLASQQKGSSPKSDTSRKVTEINRESGHDEIRPARANDLASVESQDDSHMIDPRNTEAFVRRLEEKLDQILDIQARPFMSSEYPEPIARVGQELLRHDIIDRYVTPLLERLSSRAKGLAASEIPGVAEKMMVEEFAQWCSPEFPLVAGDVALFVGPSGSGKTSVLGKVAAEALFKRKLKIKLSTLDDFRVAAQEEIAGYSEALGATLLDIDAQGKVKRGARSDDEALLIDCHSNITDQRQYSRLLERSRALNPTKVFLVVSALTRSVDLSRLIRRFEPLHPTHLIITHTDLTQTVGGIYTAMRASGLKVVAMTDSPGSLGSLLTPDPAALTRGILGRNKR